MSQHNGKMLIRLILLSYIITSSFLCAVDYSIKLMWINKALNADQCYMYPAHDEETVSSKAIGSCV